MARQTENRKLVARSVRPDSRGRVSLSAALEDAEDATFDVYRDEDGRIILEPKVTVPAAELWLFRNKAAAASVARGLKQLGEDRRVKRGSFAKYAADDDES